MEAIGTDEMAFRALVYIAHGQPQAYCAVVKRFHLLEAFLGIATHFLKVFLKVYDTHLLEHSLLASKMENQEFKIDQDGRAQRLSINGLGIDLSSFKFFDEYAHY